MKIKPYPKLPEDSGLCYNLREVATVKIRSYKFFWRNVSKTKHLVRRLRYTFYRGSEWWLKWELGYGITKQKLDQIRREI